MYFRTPKECFVDGISIQVLREYKTSMLGDCWTIFYNCWKELVESKTEEAYIVNVAQLEKILTRYPDVIGYLKKTWLTPYKEKFVSAWTDQFLNFGNHTTNRMESQHAKLKLYLDSSQSDLVTALARIHEAILSQQIAIKSSLEQSKNFRRHQFTIPHFQELVGYVSIHALEIIFKDFKQINVFGSIPDSCACQMRTSHGLPCAHEQALYSTKVELQMFNTQFNKQSRSGKVSYFQKFKFIFTPSTTSLREPTSHKSKAPTGRPRSSTKHSKIRPPVPPTEEPRRHSFAMPDYTGSNQFDLNQEPEMQRTYTFREPAMFDSFFNQEQSMNNSYFHQEQPMYYSHPLMDEISYEFHPYVTHIKNVVVDGNCGFRATTVSLGYREDYFPTIRFDLYNELLAHTEEYRWMFGRDFEAISHTLNYFGSEAVGTDRWLIMAYTGLLIANKYGVVVILLDKRGSSTFFPSRIGPQDIPNHRVVVIALVYGNHYVHVDLQRAHPMPTISALWNHFKSQRSAAWESLYGVRLNAYIPPYVPRNNYDNSRVNISDSY